MIQEEDLSNLALLYVLVELVGDAAPERDLDGGALHAVHCHIGRQLSMPFA